MTDTRTPGPRRRIMAAVQNTDTGPELLLRHARRMLRVFADGAASTAVTPDIQTSHAGLVGGGIRGRCDLAPTPSCHYPAGHMTTGTPRSPGTLSETVTPMPRWRQVAGH